MGLELVRDALVWCTAINVGLLALWFAAYALFGDWIRRMHGRWFPMSEEAFAASHYRGMMVYKLCITVFNAVPLIALLIVG